MEENELVDGVWTRKPDPTPTRPTELSLQEKVAALVLLGKTDLDDHDYSLVLDFFADDENGDDDTHTIVNVLSQYPVVATMYPVRVTELVAEIEKNFKPPINAEQASAFVNNMIYGKAVDKREPAVIPQSTSPLSSARVWSDFGRLDIAIATSLVTSADSIDAVPAADVARAKELIKEDSDQLFKRLSMELRTQSNALFIPAPLIFSIVRAAKNRTEIVDDANARHQFVESALAGWRAGSTQPPVKEAQPEQSEPREPQPEIKNIGGGMFSIDGLVGQGGSTSNEGEKTEAGQEPVPSVSQQARQELDEIGYGIYAGDADTTPQSAPSETTVTPDVVAGATSDTRVETADASERMERYLSAMKDDQAKANLAIWNRVQRTDPAFVKKNDYGAGLSSIKAQYILMRATEVFGLEGIGWGVEIKEERIDKGVPLLEPIQDQSGKIIGQRPVRDGDGSLFCLSVHTIRIDLWYIWNGQRGSIPSYGHTDYITSGRDGKLIMEKEAAKKSLTDATVKALSHLGFAADVYMDMHNDGAYTAELDVEFGIKRASEKAVDVTRLREELDEKLGRAAETIKAAVSENEATKVYGVLAREVEVHRKNAEAKGDSEHARYLSGRLRRLNDLKDARIAALKTNEGEKA
ncbi:hypothetical protein [Dickeya oryzae]